MTTLSKMAFTATGLHESEYCDLRGISKLTFHGWNLGSVKPSAREVEITARIIKGCHRHGGPSEARRMVLETLKGDYLTALAVLLIDGAYAK